MNKSFFTHWRGNFLTGLAVLFPTLVTFAVIKWLFGTVSSLTDTLLFFLPQKLTHADNGNGLMYWYWSLAAFVFAVMMITGVGLLTRHYVGERIIAWLDTMMLRVPLLNKIYGTIKQVNEAFSTGSKTSFKTVVLVEFPREGMKSIGFLTSDQGDMALLKTSEKLVSVFIPTTPNPTAGFLILVPADKITKLEMTVAEGIKYVISLGAIAPDTSGKH